MFHYSVRHYDEDKADLAVICEHYGLATQAQADRLARRRLANEIRASRAALRTVDVELFPEDDQPTPDVTPEPLETPKAPEEQPREPSQPEPSAPFEEASPEEEELQSLCREAATLPEAEFDGSHASVWRVILAKVRLLLLRVHPQGPESYEAQRLAYTQHRNASLDAVFDYLVTHTQQFLRTRKLRN